MSEFNWCHGPECHSKVTVDRVRGTKGSKVLRTRKIPINNWNRNTIHSYFCSQQCERDFWYKHVDAIRAIAPRTEPLETPIEDPKKEVVQSHWNPNHSWTETRIIKVDNAAE